MGSKSLPLLHVRVIGGLGAMESALSCRLQ